MGIWDYLKKVIAQDSGSEPEPDLAEVVDLIGYQFRDRELLLLALTHRSYNRLNDGFRPANERLEYLGDSVLGLIIAEQLYHDHPRLREGEMTKLKAMLVNETTLSTIGKSIGLNRQIRLSPDEEKLGGRERPSIIADAFESIIGAAYLDGGLDIARDIVLRLIYVNKELIASDESQRNYKGELLELVQARGQGMPRYDVVSESGPDHEKEFSVVVYVGDRQIGSGMGFTKKEAEQKAAAMALERVAENTQ